MNRHYKMNLDIGMQTTKKLYLPMDALISFIEIEYLCEAKEMGDILIVGLNSDNSVRRLKGEHRPINDQMSRALILASLLFVDAVVIFDEETPLNLIKTVNPNILVKTVSHIKRYNISFTYI